METVYRSLFCLHSKVIAEKERFVSLGGAAEIFLLQHLRGALAAGTLEP
jgi:hypothetical protein